MIGTIIGLIFTLIICGVIWWALQQLLALAAPYIGEPFMTLIRICFVVILVLIVLYVAWTLLQMSGVMSMGTPRLGPKFG